MVGGAEMAGYLLHAMTQRETEMVGGFQYRIIAAVEEDGHPCWELYRDCVNPFVFSSVLLASNRDREVLEKAIEHLNGNALKDARK